MNQTRINSTVVGVSLQDSLTIIKQSLPSKKRKLESTPGTHDDSLVGANNKNNEDLETTTSDKTWRKTYIHEMIPFLHSKRRMIDGNDNEIKDENDKNNNNSSDGKIMSESSTKTTDGNKDSKENHFNVLNRNPSDEDKTTQTNSKNESNCYVQKLNMLKKENEDISRQKQKIVDRYFHLVSSYEYGLDMVSKLNDLTSAPDNVLKACTNTSNDSDY